MSTTICPKCHHTLAIGQHPWCPHEPASYVKHPDVLYPGGLTLWNMGVPGGTTVYSESERKAIMKARSLREAVYHVPLPGSDKSPVTRSWDTPSAYTLENARILVSRQAEPKDPDAGRLHTLAVGWSPAAGSLRIEPE